MLINKKHDLNHVFYISKKMYEYVIGPQKNYFYT